MQVFILDKNPIISVQLVCDQHLGKQILEIAQVLCTVAHEVLEYDGSKLSYDNPQVYDLLKNQIPYKATHKKHPWVVWALKSKGNYDFLVDYGILLAKEYYHRFDKYHKSGIVIQKIRNKGPREGEQTKFPKFFKLLDIVCQDKDYNSLWVYAMRKYYNTKLYGWEHRATRPIKPRWTKRYKPKWLGE